MRVGQAWAKVPDAPSAEERAALKARIKALLVREKAVLVAHYYVDAELQELADETGGCVADSLEMARFGRDHDAQTLVVAGVRFMGETAKILAEQTHPDARSRRDLFARPRLPVDEFSAFCDAHPDRTVVVYANTSAAVKARADWMVTSSIGLEIVADLHARGEKIIWAPDRHLGSYIQKKPARTCCCGKARASFTTNSRVSSRSAARRVSGREGARPPRIAGKRRRAGRCGRLDHAADRCGGQARRDALHRRNRSRHPAQDAACGTGKTFIAAPTAGNSATCKSCAHCRGWR